MLVVLRYALRGGGNDFDERKMKEILASTGIISASAVVAQLLADSLTDPDEIDEGGSAKKQETSE